VEKLLGQEVAKGDTLAVIHSADLGESKAKFLEVQARLELANSTFEREKELYEKKISSQADYLSASSELKAAQAYYAAAERRLRLFGLDADSPARLSPRISPPAHLSIQLRACTQLPICPMSGYGTTFMRKIWRFFTIGYHQAGRSRQRCE